MMTVQNGSCYNKMDHTNIFLNVLIHLVNLSMNLAEFPDGLKYC